MCLCYFNVCGFRQDPRGDDAAVVPRFIERALSGRELPVLGEGERTRDYVSAGDLVEVTRRAATPAMQGVYNAARGPTVSINRPAGRIGALIGLPLRVCHLPERPGGIRHSSAEVSRLRATGFEPSTDLREGLARTIASFRARPGPWT